MCLDTFFVKGSVYGLYRGCVFEHILNDHLYAHMHMLPLTNSPILTPAISQQNNH